MENKSEKNSNFSGFLEGYRSKNIAYIKPSLEYNIEEIKYNLELLIQSIIHVKNENLVMDLKRLKSKIETSSNVIEISVFLGESLVSNPMLFELANDDNKLVKPILEKIAYHYLEIAKKSEDKKIADLAKIIERKFSL